MISISTEKTKDNDCIRQLVSGSTNISYKRLLRIENISISSKIGPSPKAEIINLFFRRRVCQKSLIIIKTFASTKVYQETTKSTRSVECAACAVRVVISS